MHRHPLHAGPARVTTGPSTGCRIIGISRYRPMAQ